MLLVGDLKIFEDKACKNNLKKVLQVKFKEADLLFCMVTNDSASIVLQDQIIHTFKGYHVDTVFIRDIVSIVNHSGILILKTCNPHINIDIPLSDDELRRFAPYYEKLSQLITQAKSITVNEKSNNSQNDLLFQLERLAVLHRNGDITPEEYKAAKTKLLG